MHVCNGQGHWGAGFVMALSRRFKAPEAAYRAKPVADHKLPPGTLTQAGVEFTAT